MNVSFSEVTSEPIVHSDSDLAMQLESTEKELLKGGSSRLLYVLA